MINLLPPDQKAEVFNEKKERIVITLMFFLVLFLLFASITIYIARYYSLNALSEKEADFASKKADFVEVTEKKDDIAALNQKVSQLDDFKDNSVNLYEVFLDVNESMKGTARLDSLEYRRDGSGGDVVYEITLSGYSPSWENLVHLEEELEDRFSNVNFSSDSWTQTKDINFFVKFEKDGNND